MPGVYVHIPLCKTRCAYCDFYSTVGPGLAGRYVDAVVREAALRIQELHGAPVTTLYVGGGTPSQLPVELMGRLLAGLRQVFVLDAVEEVTVEVNPDDVNRDYVAALAGMGVNRVSMGVQSFNDAELRAVGRRHSAGQAIDAVAAIRAAGIANLSIDLIYGLPGQTLESWQFSVNQALELRPEHISAYALSYEPGTRLWQQRERGEVCETDEETSLSMYTFMTDALRAAGYEHYEISNFALPGKFSRHNSSYWNDTPYLGLGASAHSYDGHARRYNPADMRRYIESIECGELCCEVEALTWQERYDETVMVRLRTKQGIDLETVEMRFGSEATKHLLHEARPYITAGKLKKNGSRLSLTADGVMVSDAIIRDLMW